MDWKWSIPFLRGANPAAKTAFFPKIPQSMAAFKQNGGSPVKVLVVSGVLC